LKKRFDDILILSDFDGTFAGKGTRIIERNLRAIVHFQALGGKFTFGTGRLPSMMKRYYPDFPSVVNAPLIMCNGAILFDAQEDAAIEECFYDGVQARKDISEIMKHFPEIRLGCYTDDGILQSVDSPYDIIGDKWRKTNMTFSSSESAIACRTYINQTYGDRYLCFRSGNAFAELVDKNVSKGKRISYMKEYYALSGIPSLRVFAIGDYENDMDMLQMADKAFCPSNAIPAVKAICDHVLCDHDEGAIADMIELIEELYI